MSYPLFVINSNIEKYRKKYIWGTGREAFLILARLIDQRVYVDGFIGEKEDAGMVLFHKPVISLDMIEDKENTLILSDKELPIDCFVLTNIFTHESFSAKNVVIWGGGFVGQRLASIFVKKGITVNYFLDREKNGQKLFDIPVYSPDILSELDKNITLVTAGKYWQEMDDIISKVNPTIQSFYVEKLPNETMSIRIDNHTYSALQRIHFLSEFYSDKKIIMLGNEVELARKWKEVMECLGFGEVSIMVTDEHLCDEDIRLLDEVLYEENYILILYGKNNQKSIIKKIDELSIAETDWTSVNRLAPAGHRAFMLDLNLGHTSETNYIPGIYLHGKENITDVKIAVLGGSTTEEERYPFKSWAKIMFEKYCQKNVTLYNGGIAGYTSSQELIKLFRDILCINPDMIVVYDGYNDVCFNNSRLHFRWLYNLLEYAKDAVYEHGVLDQRVREGIFTGGINSENVIGKWLINIESMCGIAQMQHIRFHSFMQPMLVSQKIHTKHGIALHKVCDAHLKHEDIQNMRLFRQRGKEIEETHPYIHDLSDIFDEKDVYMDSCHVWESGNEIIADSIWKIIEPEVRELLRLKNS